MEGRSDQRLNIGALRQRLREMGAPDRPARPTPPVTSPGSSPTLVGSIRPVAEGLPGDEVRNPSGAFQLHAQRYPATYQHAGLPLDAMWEAHGPALATLAKDSALTSFDFRRAIFLDTETNGLAGGTGTLAFLVGVAFWDDDHFEVRQFFLRHPGEEAAMLAELEPLLATREAVISFNGKSFDLPVLDARFVMARRRNPLAGRPHLDLLHPARRLWRLRLESCTLGMLEQRILSMRRSESDVPGWLVPQIYNEYLRTGNATPLARVFYHNHQDLLSLAVLAVHMATLCAGGINERAAVHHGADLFSLARLYEEAGRTTEAEAHYRMALTAPISPPIRADTIRRLTFLLKRQGRWNEATVVWEQMIGRGEMYPYEELAKFHEHHSHDLAAAERMVLTALREAQRGTLPLRRDQVEALRHRLARLRRKQSDQPE